MKRSSTSHLLQRTLSHSLNSDFDKYKRDYSDLKREVTTLIRLMQINGKRNNNGTSQETLNQNHWEIINRVNVDLEDLMRYSEELYEAAPLYDFKDVKANGFRSFLMIANKCCVILLNHIRSVNNHKNNSWSKNHNEDIKAYADCFHELSRCFYFLTSMSRMTSSNLIYNITTDGVEKTESELFPKTRSLFIPSQYLDNPQIQKLIAESNEIRQDIFYGKCLGFHYCSSTQKIFQVLSSVMSGYAHSFVTNKSGVRGLFNTVYQSMSYYVNPEIRGQLMASITRQATVEFTKHFWNLGENPLVLEAPNMILPPVEVAINFTLPPVAFSIPSSEPPRKNIVIPPPQYKKRNKTSSDKTETTHTIKLRMISFRFREGLSWLYSTASSSSSQTNHSRESFISSSIDRLSIGAFSHKKSKERSKNLLIHCHGGGFVAQSAKAHDIYLRIWAEKLNCPILSIDYSLAPEYPYPIAVQECYYAISWALRNRRQLGCTSNARVVLCGDSAGANLALCASIMAADNGVPLCDAMMLAYIPSLVTMTPSPARLLSTLDPLLPLGVLARCLLAYVGIDETNLIKSASKLESKESKVGEVNVDMPHLAYFRKLTKSHSTVSDKSNKFSYNSEMSSSSPLNILRSAKIPLDPFLSPLMANDKLLRKLPPIIVVGTHLDPLLDDCVELCKVLDNVGVNVELDVLHDIPHGFLNFVLLSRECELGSQKCVSHINKLFNMINGDSNGTVSNKIP